MAYSFGTSGAVSAPQIGPSSLSSLQGAGLTPASKALNAVSSGGVPTNTATPYKANVAPAPTNTSTPYNANIAPVTSGLIPKSQTINNVDGSSHTVTYHAPDVQTNASAPISQSTSSSGMFGLTNAQIANAKTPEEIALASGQPAPTMAPQAPATGPTNTPYSASNPPTTSPGLLGAGLGQAQGYYNAQQGLTDESKALIGRYNAQEAASTNQFNGTASDEAGHNAQLENLLNSGVSRIESEQGKQAAYESPLATLYGQGASVLEPGNQSVTAPAGQVTTNTATGQQYSNPILGPIGSQQFYSPQPGGTPGQPGTAGQPQSYTIKSGDTFYTLAGGDQAKISAIEAANPGVNPNNLQPGQTINLPSSQSGSPFTAGEVAGQTALGTQYAQNFSAYKQAEAIRGNIDSIINSNPQLNPSSFTDVNSALSFLNGKVSNPAYAVLANNVAEYVNTLAPILGVGGDTTNYKTALAQQFLNGASSGQSMSQIMAGIAQTAALKLQQQQSAGGSTGSVSIPGGASGGSNDPLGIR